PHRAYFYAQAKVDTVKTRSFMALTKDKKVDVVKTTSDLLAGSKLTVLAKYGGTSVKSLQQLRRDAKADGTKVQVIKNRLFKLALAGDERFADVDASLLSGQLIYAFNSEDEVAPAQALAKFAKNEPQMEFVGAITADGQFLAAEDVKALADLPSKEQLRGMLVGTIAAPLSGFVNVMSGSIRGVINVLNARAGQLEG
ncbi:MAG TPA: 50S ribosomal protein L10, partial [Candidatus Saccharimonadales bacterium]|nr:50S ribosomal protein L10 [Candidatus Saccharimonadales bacterium]